MDKFRLLGLKSVCPFTPARALSTEPTSWGPQAWKMLLGEALVPLRRRGKMRNELTGVRTQGTFRERALKPNPGGMTGAFVWPKHQGPGFHHGLGVKISQAELPLCHLGSLLRSGLTPTHSTLPWRVQPWGSPRPKRRQSHWSVCFTAWESCPCRQISPSSV